MARPQTIEELNNLPIKQVGSSTIYIRDVANVRDGFTPQTNIVRVNGKRAALMSILKRGDVSTLDMISNVKKMLPPIEAGLPPAFRRSRSRTNRYSCRPRSTAWCAKERSPPA